MEYIEYIGLAALIYVISGFIMFIYAMGSKDGKDISIYTVFCPVINTIAIFVIIIKFIIKAIIGLIDLIKMLYV